MFHGPSLMCQRAKRFDEQVVYSVDSRARGDTTLIGEVDLFSSAFKIK